MEVRDRSVLLHEPKTWEEANSGRKLLTTPSTTGWYGPTLVRGCYWHFQSAPAGCVCHVFPFLYHSICTERRSKRLKKNREGGFGLNHDIQYLSKQKENKYVLISTIGNLFLLVNYRKCPPFKIMGVKLRSLGASVLQVFGIFWLNECVCAEPDKTLQLFDLIWIKFVGAGKHLKPAGQQLYASCTSCW